MTIPAATLALLLVLTAPACGAASDALDSASPEPAAAPAPSPDRDALTALYHATDGPNWKRNSNWLSEAPLGLWNLVHTDSGGRVTSLWLHENRLRGQLPPKLGGLTELVLLFLNGNQLRDEVPPELGNLANLDTLMLNDNELRGEIPAELGHLTNLTNLRLDNNQLTGEIPPELENLSHLTMLMLGGNQLTGCIPAGLSNVFVNDFDEVGLPFCATSDSPEAVDQAAESRTGLPTVGDSLVAVDGLEVKLDSVQRFEQLAQVDGPPFRPKNGLFQLVTITFHNTNDSGNFVVSEASIVLMESDGIEIAVDSASMNALSGMAVPATEGRPLFRVESVPSGQTATVAVVFDVDPGLVDLLIDIEGFRFEIPKP